MKMVALSESLEIARAVYLGQIMNIESSRVQKSIKGVLQGGPGY